MNIDTNTEVNKTTLATVLGLTARRIDQLSQDGVIGTVSRGKYLLCDSIQKYNKFCNREKAKTNIEIDMQNADAKLKKAKATKATLETQELVGKMHRSEDIEYMVTELLFALRGMMLALPGRLAIDCANISDPAEASERIRNEVYLIMEEMANYKYDAAKYEELVRERLSWDKIDVEDGDFEDNSK